MIDGETFERRSKSDESSRDLENISVGARATRIGRFFPSFSSSLFFNEKRESSVADFARGIRLPFEIRDIESRAPTRSPFAFIGLFSTRAAKKNRQRDRGMGAAGIFPYGSHP